MDEIYDLTLSTDPIMFPLAPSGGIYSGTVALKRDEEERKRHQIQMKGGIDKGRNKRRQGIEGGILPM